MTAERAVMLVKKVTYFKRNLAIRTINFKETASQFWLSTVSLSRQWHDILDFSCCPKTYHYIDSSYQQLQLNEGPEGGGGGGGGGGGPNPISQQIVFFKSQLKSDNPQPVLVKLKSHSHFSIVFVSWIPVPVHKVPFPSL